MSQIGDDDEQEMTDCSFICSSALNVALNNINICKGMVMNKYFSSLSPTSLIDRRGFVQADTPQLAPPTNGIAMYGATQSQQSHMVSPC